MDLGLLLKWAADVHLENDRGYQVMSGPCRGSVYEKCYSTLAYVTTGKRFTVAMLAERLGIGKNTAAKHLDAVIMYFPISEVTERKYGGTLGSKPAVYQYIKDYGS